MAQKREMSPNQVVAENLWRARKAASLSQEQTSQALAERGVSWEKATYYAAEAGRHPDKEPRRFSADELIAFALIFEKPVAWFLTPPEDATLVLNKEPLYLRDLLEIGLNEYLGDMRPLAELARQFATAVETFEEGRRPESEAEAITRATVDLGHESGDLAKRRLAMEMERIRGRTFSIEERDLLAQVGLEFLVDDAMEEEQQGETG